MNEAETAGVECQSKRRSTSLISDSTFGYSPWSPDCKASVLTLLYLALVFMMTDDVGDDHSHQGHWWKDFLDSLAVWEASCVTASSGGYCRPRGSIFNCSEGSGFDLDD